MLIMLNWKNIILSPDASLTKAIEVLDRDDPRIVLVVDEMRSLLGTVTDGDIRRGLLQGKDLNSKVVDVMNLSPKVAHMGEDIDVIRSRMENLCVKQMPIVDNDMKVIGLETLKHLSESAVYDNPVFIMAGGFGTRLRPLTDDVPKPMLKVGAKPILERIIESFVKAGFHEFYISIHYKADMVRDYFKDGERWGVDITYIREDEPLGTAGALKLLPASISKLPIILMNGDILTTVNYRNLLEFHEENNSIATVCVKEYDIQVPYGVVEGDDYVVTEIVEKPVQRFLVNAGIYVLSQSVLKEEFGSGYLEMPSLLDSFIKSDRNVTMFPIHEYWIDIGHMEEYERAQEEVHWV